MKKQWMLAVTALLLSATAAAGFLPEQPAVSPAGPGAVQSQPSDPWEKSASRLEELLERAAAGAPDAQAQQTLAAEFRTRAEELGPPALEAAGILEAMARGEWPGSEAVEARAASLASLPGLPGQEELSVLLARAWAGSVLDVRYQAEAAAGMVVITAAGDCTFGQYPEVPQEISFEAEMARQGGDLTYPLAGSRAFFSPDSLTILNCEGTFTNREEMAQKRYRFKGDPSYARIFALGSVEAVNLANNHSMDYLEGGYEDTVEALSQAGVASFGLGQIRLVDFPAGRVALLGYNTVDQGEPDLTPDLARDIAWAREQGADLVVVSIHWGYEYYNDPAPYQRAMGRAAVDLGADLVIGHHPHVIQGLEEYKGRTILYSLGNYAFGGDEEIKDRDTFAFRQAFILKEGKAEPWDAMIFPFYISGREDRNDYSPVPVFGAEAARIAGRLEELSARIPGSSGPPDLSWLE